MIGFPPRFLLPHWARQLENYSYGGGADSHQIAWNRTGLFSVFEPYDTISGWYDALPYCFAHAPSQGQAHRRRFHTRSRSGVVVAVSELGTRTGSRQFHASGGGEDSKNSPADYLKLRGM